MGTMKAAVVRGDQIIVEDVQKPIAGPNEVIIGVRYCGVCGSDVHRFSANSFADGMIMGHELSGIVDEVGKNVTGWKKGDRVVAIAYSPCRKCGPCLRGEYQLCEKKFWIGVTTDPGAYAEFVKVLPDMLLPIPDKVSEKAAAMSETLSVALHALRTANFTIGDKAVVIGAGPIGLLVAQCLRLAGARELVVIEIAQGRFELAAKLGADKVIKPDHDDWIQEVKDFLGSEPDMIFECAGTENTLQSAAELIRPGGKIIMVSVSMKPVAITPIVWGRKEAELKVSTAYCDEFPFALELLEKERIDVESLISEVIPLNEIDRALKKLKKPNEQIKVLVDPHSK